MFLLSALNLIISEIADAIIYSAERTSLSTHVRCGFAHYERKSSPEKYSASSGVASAVVPDKALAGVGVQALE